MPLFSKNTYLQNSLNKTKFFMENTKKTDINSVNEQNNRTEG